MQSKGGYDEVTEVSDKDTPSGKYVVSVAGCACTPHFLPGKILCTSFRTFCAFFPTPLPANHGPNSVSVISHEMLSQSLNFLMDLVI